MTKTIFLLTLLIFAGLAFYPFFTYAQDITINCQNQICSPQSLTNQLSWDNIAPGSTRSFAIKLINNHPFLINAVFKINWQNPKPQLPVIHFQINQDNTTIYKGYPDQDLTLNLGTLSTSDTLTLYLILTANPDLDNNYQSTSFQFTTNLYVQEITATDNNVASFLTPTPTSSTNLTPLSINPLPSPSLSSTTNFNLKQVLGQNTQPLVSSAYHKIQQPSYWASLLTAGLFIITLFILRYKTWLLQWLKRIKST